MYMYGAVPSLFTTLSISYTPIQNVFGVKRKIIFKENKISPSPILKTLLNLLFHWRKTALRCCLGVCHTTMQISHYYTYITSLLSLLFLCHLTPLSQQQGTRISSLHYIATFHQLSISHMVVYIRQCYFLHLIPLSLCTLSPHPRAHKSILHICIFPARD